MKSTRSLAICAILAASLALLIALEPDCAMKWKEVSKGGCAHTIAIHEDGTLWGWGDNTYGQVGDGTSGNHVNRPKKIKDGVWTAVSAGCHHSLAVNDKHELHAWGHNNLGQLGDETTDDSNVPKQIEKDTKWRAVFADGVDSSFAIDTDNNLWAFGDNSFGQLGLEKKTASESKPVKVGTEATWESIAPGTKFTFGLQTDSSLYGWGDNTKGQLGDGTTEEKLIPTKIGIHKWRSVAAGPNTNSLGIDTTGYLWGWGCDIFSCDTAKSEPEKIDLSGSWSQVYISKEVVLGLKDDGSFWGWGLNTQGQLGNGKKEKVQEPTQIGKDTDWIAIAGGDTFSKGLKAQSKQLLTWGFSDKGALGYGDDSKQVLYPDVCPGDFGCVDSKCSACPTGTLKFEGKCMDCAEGCIACTETTTKCTACKMTFFLNEETHTCEKCNDACVTCQGKATQCTSCKDGLFVSEEHECKACEKSCKTCKDKANFCLTCEDEKLQANSDGVCGGGCAGFLCPLPIIITLLVLAVIGGGIFAFLRYRANKRAPGEGLLDADNADDGVALKMLSN